ncbi:MAG: tetratricopeptide repeat protein [Dehalococcoidia bacterium]
MLIKLSSRLGFYSAVVLAASIPLLTSACQEAGEPSATLSPTPPPADPQLAHTFARNGQYDEALAVYQAILDHGPATIRQDARLARARLFLNDHRYQDARTELDAFLDEAPPGSDLAAARFLLAQALAALGDTEQALSMYQAYISAGGGASTYARMERALLLAELGRSQEAEAEADNALPAGLPDEVRRSFILNLAQSHEGAGALPEARQRYEQLFEESPVAADQALALWRSAAIRRAQGDPLWSHDALTVLVQYPATSAASAALDELLPAGVAVDPYYQGLVHLRAFRNEEAQAAFERYLAQTPQPPLAGSATYYWAVLAERRGDTEDALEAYTRAHKLNPRGPLADDALWWRARLLEADGRLSEAELVYDDLLTVYPDSEWAAEASFRHALVAYKQRRYEDATGQWTLLARNAHGDEAARLLFWAAKAALAAHSPDGPATLERAAAAAPDSYYGLRAALLASDSPQGDPLKTDVALLPDDAPDWSAADAWLADALRMDPAVAVDRILLDPRWALGQELLALGMRREASAEFTTLLDNAAGDAAALYHLARAFHALALTDLSARAAARLLSQLPPETAARAPPEVLHLAYPADYVEVLLETAQAQDMPPLLLLALIRQESFFDPLAGSAAGALGLTQVIPSTAQAIAESLDEEDFQTRDLLRPAVSLRFGATYLSDQLDTFDGNLYHTLASYNGGPGNALRWRDLSGGDVDLFLEEIDFHESRLFVKLVMEHLARYRQLYEGLERPALPAEQVQRN